VSKPKILASGLLIAVFVSGVIVGGAGRVLADPSDESQRRGRSQGYLEWLGTEMDLNARQETAIAVILDQYNEDMHELWSSVRPRSQEIRQGARAFISEILDEEQREAYSRLNARLDSIRAEKRQERDEED
jgi:hypothetical protein